MSTPPPPYLPRTCLSAAFARSAILSMHRASPDYFTPTVSLPAFESTAPAMLALGSGTTAWT